MHSNSQSARLGLGSVFWSAAQHLANIVSGVLAPVLAKRSLFDEGWHLLLIKEEGFE